MPPLECVSIPAAANLLSCSKSTIYQLCAEGDLTPIKIGRRTVVPLRSIQAFIERAMAEAEAGRASTS